MKRLRVAAYCGMCLSLASPTSYNNVTYWMVEVRGHNRNPPLSLLDFNQIRVKDLS